MEDVIIGREGMMFLATSIHNILDHITGKIQIPSESVENFARNVTTRSQFCRERSIAYRHVIYPDKTTVLRSYFPIADITPYSAHYRQHYASTVLDLADRLPDSAEYFLRTDTHLSFVGMIKTTFEVMKEFFPQLDEVVVTEALKKHRGVQYEMLGDLGSKVAPQEREFDFRVSNQAVRAFHNQTGANDGLTIVLFNLTRLKEGQRKRLLIFGDSFAERSIRLFAHFYSEILFCRTRYLHWEIALMFKPDHLITESAERYFSYVRLDHEAPRFNLLYGLRGSRYSDDKEFYTAYNAVLNFGSPTYETFVKRLLAADGSAENSE